MCLTSRQLHSPSEGWWPRLTLNEFQLIQRHSETGSSWPSWSRSSYLVGRRRVVGPHDQRARELALRLAHVHHRRHRALRVRRQHHRAPLEDDLNQIYQVKYVNVWGQICEEMVKFMMSKIMCEEMVKIMRPNM